MHWEYLIESFDEWDESDVQELLNKLGQERWELVHVSTSLRTYFFKREILI